LKKIVAAAMIAVLCVLACTEKKPSDPVPNKLPETHLFLVIGDSLGVADTTARPDTSASMLILHWYGDDSDGEIIGFEWAWDDTSSDSAWTYTDLVTDTFYVKIREPFRFFTFYVRSVDSDSAPDPTPAFITFPIINSPPSMRLPVGLVNDYSPEHSITFGHQTITWSSSDPDGDETISGCQISLADTSFHWDPDTTINDTIRFAALDWDISLDSLTFSYTFTDLEPGCYRMFLRSFDITGSYSDVVYYPETTGVWEVIEAHGEILYVDDNAYYTYNDTLFVHFLDSLGLEYTSLSFIERPFYYAQDFELALNDFNILIYNAGETRHLSDTGPPITNFVNSGGHLMTNAIYSTIDTTTYSFMPIDSIYDYNITRPFRFSQPDSLNYLDGYPIALETSLPAFFSKVFGFAPKAPEGINGSGYKVLYIIGATVNDPASIGDTVAVRFPYDPDAEIQEPAKVIFFSFPVFDCNVNSGFAELYSHILLNEFADE